MSIKKSILKKINNIKVGFALSLASADKIILTDDHARVPESTNIVSQNFSRHDFVRSIQQGKFTEQQLIMFYKLLDKFDDQHGRVEVLKIKDGYIDPETGEWVEPEMCERIISMEEHEGEKAKLGDSEEGYHTEMFLVNKEVLIKDVHMWGIHEFDGMDGKQLDEAIKEHTKWEPTLIIHREFITYGVPRIEDYAHEIFVKIKHGQDFKKDKSCLVEFYCFNFNRKRVEADSKDGFFGEVNENVFDKLSQGYTLDHFKNFTEFSIKEITATRNDIQYHFKVNLYHSIKKLEKGFVIKFLCELV